MTIGIVTAAIAAALVFVLRRALRRRKYARLLDACLERQPQHEVEHSENHLGEFTSALRVEAVARRLERKIHDARLPPLSAADLRRRAREGVCRSLG